MMMASLVYADAGLCALTSEPTMGTEMEGAVAVDGAALEEVAEDDAEADG